MGQGTTKFSREMSNFYTEMYQNCMKTVNLGVEIDEFHTLLNTPSLKAKEQYGDLNKWLYVRTAFILMSIRNFMQHLEQMTEKEPLLKFASRMKLEPVFNALYNVEDRDSFETWLRETRTVKELKSQAIGTGDEGELEVELPATDQDALKEFKKSNFKKETGSLDELFG